MTTLKDRPNTVVLVMDTQIGVLASALEAAEDNPYPAMTLSAGIHYYASEVAWIDETLEKLDGRR